MLKITDNEVASKLWIIQIRLRGIAHLLEYHRLETIPLDIDECMTGIAEIMNGLVEEIRDLKNLFDPSRDDDADLKRGERDRRF